VVQPKHEHWYASYVNHANFAALQLFEEMFLLLELPPISSLEKIYFENFEKSGILRNLRTKTFRIGRCEFKTTSFSWYANLCGDGILCTSLCSERQI
jgi:hypothetical protein